VMLTIVWSKGPRGTIWRLHQHHLHVWKAIEVVQKVRGYVYFDEGSVVFEIFGVRRKVHDGDMLIISDVP
jgi:hypothetical protein